MRNSQPCYALVVQLGALPADVLQMESPSGGRSTLIGDVRVIQPFPRGPIVVIDERAGRHGVWETHFDERTHDIVASKGLERTERMSGRVPLAELLTPEIANAVIRLLGGAIRFRES